MAHKGCVFSKKVWVTQTPTSSQNKQLAVENSVNTSWNVRPNNINNKDKITIGKLSDNETANER